MENEWQIQQVVDGLFIGSRHCREENNWEIKAHDIGMVVDVSNLQTEQLPAVPEGCWLMRVAMDDREDQQIMPILKQILQAVADSNNNARVLVHCNQGISRSATCILAILMVQHKMTLKEAFHLLRSKRRVIHPNNGFMKQLLLLEGEVHNGVTTCKLDGSKILWK